MHFAQLKPNVQADRVKLLRDELHQLDAITTLVGDDLRINVDQATYLRKVALFAKVFQKFSDIIEKPPQFPEVPDNFWQ